MSASDFLRTYSPKAEFYVGFANMFPVFVGLLVMSKWGHKLSLSRRVYTSLGLLTVLMTSPIVIDVAVRRYGWNKATTGLWLILGSLFASACCAAVLQSSLYGLAGMLAPDFTAKLQQGKGWVGILIILARMATKAALPDDVRLASFVFFGFAWLVVVSGLVSFFVLMKQPFTIAKLDNNLQQDREERCDFGNALFFVFCFFFFFTLRTSPPAAPIQQQRFRTRRTQACKAGWPMKTKLMRRRHCSSRTANQFLAAMIWKQIQ